MRRNPISPRFDLQEGEYEAGRQAFRDGFGLNSCPHLKGDARYSWLLGMLDAQTDAFFKHLETLSVRDAE